MVHNTPKPKVTGGPAKSLRISAACTKYARAMFRVHWLLALMKSLHFCVEAHSNCEAAARKLIALFFEHNTPASNTSQNFKAEVSDISDNQLVACTDIWYIIAHSEIRYKGVSDSS